jgi:methionyl-tRNA formyltransferase
MTEQVDAGEVLVEEFVDVAGLTTVEHVYNRLYPVYALAIVKALRLIRERAELPATAWGRA